MATGSADYWLGKGSGLRPLRRHGQLHASERIAHEWIFPQCRCIVHHGGAGTTARALQSGVPSVIVPILKWADQTFWARRVEAVDCGLHVPEPSQEKLEEAIEIACTSAKIRSGCGDMKESVKNETGLATAVEMIETAWAWSEEEKESGNLKL